MKTKVKKGKGHYTNGGKSMKTKGKKGHYTKGGMKTKSKKRGKKFMKGGTLTATAADELNFQLKRDLEEARAVGVDSEQGKLDQDLRFRIRREQGQLNPYAWVKRYPDSNLVQENKDRII